MQTLTNLESYNKGSEIVVRIGNDGGTWQFFGENKFNSTTTIQDILNYLHSNSIRADKAFISSNANTNSYNNSLPITGGSNVEIQPFVYGVIGSWDRGYIKVTDKASGQMYIAGINNHTIGTFKQVTMS